MKVAINRGEGNFGISEAAKDHLIAKGMKIAKREFGTGNLPDYSAEIIDNRDGYSKRYSYYDDFTLNEYIDKSVLRTDHRLIEVIELLGDKASGPNSKLKVVTIPDDIKFRIAGTGVHAEFIEEYQECYRTWR